MSETMSRLRCALQVLTAVILFGTPCQAAPLSTAASVTLGDGRSMVVEYDMDFRPVRRYPGLEEPTDITVLADGALLLVDKGAGRVMLVDSDGELRWNEQVGDRPVRARPRPGGGFLITARNEIIATDADLRVEWRRRVVGVQAAVPLPNGNILTAANDRRGWITETTPEGTLVWKSKPEGRTDPSGRWVAEDSEQYFRSVTSLDVGPDGTIFTADSDRGQLRVLSPDYRNLRRTRFYPQCLDTRIGPAGELVAVSPGGYGVSLELSDGTRKWLDTRMRPLAANMSPNGTLLVGLKWEPENAVLNATAQQNHEKSEVAWWRRAWPVPALGLLVGFLGAVLFRWPEIRIAVGRPRPGSHGR